MDAFQNNTELELADRERITRSLVIMDEVCKVIQPIIDAFKKGLRPGNFEEEEEYIWVKNYYLHHKIALPLSCICLHHNTFHQSISIEEVSKHHISNTFTPYEIYNIFCGIPLCDAEHILQNIHNYWEIIDAIQTRNYDAFQLSLYNFTNSERNYIKFFCLNISIINKIDEVMAKRAENLRGGDIEQQTTEEIEKIYTILSRQLGLRIDELKQYTNIDFSNDNIDCEHLLQSISYALESTIPLYDEFREFEKEIYNRAINDCFNIFPEITCPLYYQALDKVGQLEMCVQSRNNLPEVANIELDKYLANRPKPKDSRGRPKLKWLKEEYEDEAVWKHIQDHLWNHVRADFDKFKLTSKHKDGSMYNIDGNKRESVIVSFMYCFFFFLAEKNQIGNPGTENGSVNTFCQVSGCNRGTFNKYYKVFERWDEYQEMKKVATQLSRNRLNQGESGIHLLHNNNHPVGHTPHNEDSTDNIDLKAQFIEEQKKKETEFYGFIGYNYKSIEKMIERYSQYLLQIKAQLKKLGSSN